MRNLRIDSHKRIQLRRQATLWNCVSDAIKSADTDIYMRKCGCVWCHVCVCVYVFKSMTRVWYTTPPLFIKSSPINLNLQWRFWNFNFKLPDHLKLHEIWTLNIFSKWQSLLRWNGPENQHSLCCHSVQKNTEIIPRNRLWKKWKNHPLLISLSFIYQPNTIELQICFIWC